MSIILNYINYFWKLGYNEEISDIYIKKYHGSYCVTIDMDHELMDYGDMIKISDGRLTQFSQKNFVILECVDRLLEKSYSPNSLHIGKNNGYDITVKDTAGNVLIAIKCEIWENDYDNEVYSIRSNPGKLSSFFEQNNDVKYLCIYTSRLKAGLIEYKNAIFPLNSSNCNNKKMDQFKNDTVDVFYLGVFEENVEPYHPILVTPIDQKKVKAHKTIDGFEIENDVLIRYTGKDSDVDIPNGVKKLGNGVFWNCTSMINIKIPNSVTNLGGDTFYNCINLTNLNIPSGVMVMGDNPFANCPSLTLVNNSPYFIFENGALYNKEKTKLIYYSIKNNANTFTIPDGVTCIGKHAFFNCANLQRIIIPRSVTIMENNPFSNCPSLTLVNHSSNFILEDGVLYNKPKTTLIYYAMNKTSDSFEIPDGIKIIGRHSFYNCRNLSTLTIPASVEIIGYNPFTNCDSLTLVNKSPNYVYENGALFNKSKTELIYFSISNPVDSFVIPDTVTSIGRSAFSGCINLKRVTIPDGVTNVGKSAFANCTNLITVNIPNSMISLEEWAFYNCAKLAHLEIPKHTRIEGHTFFNCPAKIVRNQ